jgi:uncharacterized ferritin-like protein (DUF455 family)
MINFFAALEEVLFEKNIQKKLDTFKDFYQDFLDDTFEYESKIHPKEHINPTYYGFLNIVPQENLPARVKLDSDEGKARFVHAIVHIEYSAIDLALDHAYRFRELPFEYYKDWLEVAEDEIRHFLLLEKLLDSIGYKYGDFDVHQALFDAKQATKTLRSRMAVVPRYLEANGLDANVKMMEKLQGVGDKKAKEIRRALEIILNEEVSHVQKGDKWFEYACKLDNVDKSIYFDEVKAIMPNAWRSRGFVNIDARVKSGFSEDEIKRIKQGE